MAELHRIVKNAMGWDNEYLHSLQIYGEDYGIANEGGMTFKHNPHQVFIDTFGFDAGDRFTYTLNYFCLLAVRYPCRGHRADVRANAQVYRWRRSAR